MLMEDQKMSKAKLYSAVEAAEKVGLKLGSFRVKVCFLKEKGIRQNRKVFYSFAQVEKIRKAPFVKVQ